jgi:hypothetical protein
MAMPEVVSSEEWLKATLALLRGPEWCQAMSSVWITADADTATRSFAASVDFPPPLRPSTPTTQGRPEGRQRQLASEQAREQTQRATARPLAHRGRVRSSRNKLA